MEELQDTCNEEGWSKTSVARELPPNAPRNLTALRLSNTRHVSAAATGCDLLPGSDRRPVHAGRAALSGVAVEVQQRRRVPGRWQRDQPQVAGADICHWRAAALPVHISTTSGEACFLLSFDQTG